MTHLIISIYILIGLILRIVFSNQIAEAFKEELKNNPSFGYMVNTVTVLMNLFVVFLWPCIFLTPYPKNK